MGNHEIHTDQSTQDEDNESDAPCGNFKADFSKNVTDFHVDGDAVSSDAALSSLPASSTSTSSSDDKDNSAASYAALGPVVSAGTLVMGMAFACLI